uniref:Uncharacterized protein n=1 Tax=viral metagenome TaxID=1070528 RepID=A0A6H1ZG02_9ZZZZ
MSSVEAEVLSPAIGITKEIDPKRWAIEFDLGVQRSIVDGWDRPKPSKGMSKEDKAEMMDDDSERLELHKARLAELEAKLVEYDKEPGKARITIRLMDPVKFTDTMAQRSILLGKSMGEIETIRAQIEIDRETIAWGVCGHKDVELQGKPIVYQTAEVDFDGEKHMTTHRKTVKEYERLGWRISLPGAIVRFNQLSEEKKSE